MSVVIAKHAGFCFGVRRAIEIVNNASNTSRKQIFTYGPIIHNPQVLQVLSQKGIKILDKIPEQGNGTVIIRAHGISPDLHNRIKDAGFCVIDATCPRIVKIQSIIKYYSRKNYEIILIGDYDHPEVLGLKGYTKGTVNIVNNLHDIKKLKKFKQAIVIAQTTQNKKIFKEIKGWVGNHHLNYLIFDTICESTEKRQIEVKKFENVANAIVVIGGYNSGNTKRLYEVGTETGLPSIHIETEKDFTAKHIKILKNAKTVGITAGASTPNWSIEKVRRTIREIKFMQKKGLFRFLYRSHKLFLLYDLYLAMGAASLTYACSHIQGLKNYMPYIILSMLCVPSMHLLNHLFLEKKEMINTQLRESFHHTFRFPLILIGIAACIIGLVTSYVIDQRSFVILTLMSLLGLSYNLKLVPEKYGKIKLKRLKDIPGSKTFLIALAWGVTTAILNPLIEVGKIDYLNILIFFWACALAFIRSASFDLLYIQADGILGKETLAVLLGKNRSFQLLQLILLFFIITFLFSILFLNVPSASIIVIIGSLFCFFILSILKKVKFISRFRIEFLIEAQLIVIGIIAFVWSAILKMLHFSISMY